MRDKVLAAVVEHGRDWIDYATLAATLFGVGVVSLYTYYAKKQRDEAKRANDLAVEALEASRQSSRDALEQTRRSNAATERSNEIAEQALLVGNRAWIVPTIEHPTPPNAEVVRVKIDNRGGIPAMLRQDGQTAKVFPAYGFPETFDVPADEFTPSTTIIAPSANINALIMLPVLSAEEADGLLLGNKTILACVHFHYTDAFGKSWQTKVCWWRDDDGKWFIADKLCQMI